MMNDPGTTSGHQQPCRDTIIIVNIPQLAREDNPSPVQLQSPDVSKAVTSNQQLTTFASIQQQISETTGANTVPLEPSQQYAKGKPVLCQQSKVTNRPVRRSNMNVDRTALALGERSPAEELSMDVTQITSPADGYFCRENILRAQQLSSGLPHASSRSGSASLPLNRARQQVNGFSTPPPSLPQMKLDFSEDDGNSNLDANDVCYFSHNAAVHQSSPVVTTNRTVVPASQKPAVVTSKQSETIVVNGRASSMPGHRLGGHVPGQADGRILVGMGASSARTVVSPCCIPRESPTSRTRQICVVAAGAHPQLREMVNRYQRPQYSYLHLIQMAISSTPEKQMTLKQIYRWIEDNFLYYSYTPNQGWKNSIRHNLSLYDIFVRKKPREDSKKRTSYWTLSSDVSLKSAKANRQQANSETPQSSGVSAPAGVVPSQTVTTAGSTAGVQLSPAVNSVPPSGTFATSRQKKGPVPLLPKVSPMQAYALIPIQGAVMSPQPFLLPSWSVGSPHLISTASGTSTVQRLPAETGMSSLHQSLTSLKRNLDPCGEPCKKQVKIAPKLDNCATTHSVPTLDVSSASRAAFTPCLNRTGPTHQASSSSSSNSRHKSLRLRSVSATELTPKTVVTRCHVTPRIMRQRRGSVSGVTSNQSSFDDSGFDLSSQKADTSGSGSLPRPRMYRRKCSLKHSGMTYENQNDREVTPTCRGDHPVLDIDSPLCSVIDVTSKTPNRKTSTPFKENVCSPSWISPIKELTPLSGASSHFDSGCFFTPDSATRPLSSSSLMPSRGVITDLCSSPKLHQGTFSVGLDASPKLGSLRSLGMPGLTPMKSSTDAVLVCSPNSSWSASLNHSFTRLFDDCHLNPIIDDDMDFSFSTLL